MACIVWRRSLNTRTKTLHETSSGRCSTWAATVAMDGCNAAATFATISLSSSKKPFSASRQKSRSAALRCARSAGEPELRPVADPETCQQCAGRGQVRYQQGFFSIARTCPICNGAGQVITHPCLQCNGAGLTDRRHSISVSVPAGVEDGTRIRYQGEGDAGRAGGPRVTSMWCSR